MKPLLLLVAIFVLSLPVQSQIPSQNPEYVQPVHRQLDEGQCHRLMVESLYQATDVNDPLQQQYLWAAEAYEKLAEAHQTCA